MELAFEPWACDPSRPVHGWPQNELQRIEVSQQNRLAQEPGAVISGSIGGMQTKLIDYGNFMKFRK